MVYLPSDFTVKIYHDGIIMPMSSPNIYQLRHLLHTSKLLLRFKVIESHFRQDSKNAGT